MHLIFGIRRTLSEPGITCDTTISLRSNPGILRIDFSVYEVFFECKGIWSYLGRIQFAQAIDGKSIKMTVQVNRGSVRRKPNHDQCFATIFLLPKHDLVFDEVIVSRFYTHSCHFNFLKFWIAAWSLALFLLVSVKIRNIVSSLKVPKFEVDLCSWNSLATLINEFTSSWTYFYIFDLTSMKINLMAFLCINNIDVQ